MGVTGISLSEGDRVVSMMSENEGRDVLIASEKGIGKRTSREDFRPQNRGGKGLKCYKITEKTGSVIGASMVDDDDQIMIITSEGVIIRMNVNDISRVGRIASGVKLVNMAAGVQAVSFARITAGMVQDSEEDTEE